MMDISVSNNEKSISYKYLVFNHNKTKLVSWEALPSNRSHQLEGGMHHVVRDGQFGVNENSMLCRSRSIGKDSDECDYDHKHLNKGEEDLGKKNKPDVWVANGWLVNSAQLHILLGHSTILKKKPPIRLFTPLEIDHIVVRSVTYDHF